MKCWTVNILGSQYTGGKKLLERVTPDQAVCLLTMFINTFKTKDKKGMAFEDFSSIHTQDMFVDLLFSDLL